MTATEEASTEAPPPQTRKLADESKFILTVYKYDPRTKETRTAATVPASKDLKGKTLQEIRYWLINTGALNKNLAKRALCTSNGGEVPDSTTLTDYFAMNGIAADAASGTVYIKSGGSEELDESMQSWLSKGLDLSGKNAPTLASIQAATLSSSYSHGAWKASEGNGQVVHPSDLSEKQWATVLRNNDMLCGHYLKAGRAEEELVFTGLEPRYYPAFAIAKRQIPDYDIPAGAAEGDFKAPSMDFRIPRFRITDKARVDVLELKSSLQVSMAESAFSQTTVEASIGGSFCGVSAGVKAGYSGSDESNSASSTSSSQEFMYISYDFPRVEVYLDQESLEVSAECKRDLDILRQMRTKEELERFYKKYGHVFVPQVQLGGRLYSIESSQSFGSATKEQRTQMMKASASASFSGYGAKAEVSASHEKNTAQEKTSTSSTYNHSITWHADGGDTLLCNNPPSWCPTVANYQNWRIMKRNEGVDLIEMIGKIDGFKDIPRLVQYIDDVFVGFKLYNSATNELANKAVYHYQTAYERYPIVNYPEGRPKFSFVLQAAAKKTQVYWDHGIPRMKYGVSYRPCIYHEGNWYGIRRTTKADHFGREGILYAGRDEDSNISMTLISNDGKKKPEDTVGTYDNVLLAFHDMKGEYIGSVEVEDDMIFLGSKNMLNFELHCV
ncbi:hypothetical protein BDV32DRAFT_150116 [Aspergillus pseudonomiae]|uniref:MACPF-like domain-containing protein n=1 Tax=Aspergillus pseudonomiae TaxID=1506151 RepID=A0A5N6I0M3_9EURO|nr:uncharacterized protein BDV37DRAFT_280848 [Aspergillus pseudonomiae]KAB8259694.1 hypothetical protein BDV32DRAFT_150116 [Aspergillus pseudonomiae]KAE8406574.1 hypothetical protein BDV37DRAFT_280848 [Aspergillus pseudonomiae]